MNELNVILNTPLPQMPYIDTRDVINGTHAIRSLEALALSTYVSDKVECVGATEITTDIIKWSVGMEDDYEDGGVLSDTVSKGIIMASNKILKKVLAEYTKSLMRYKRLLAKAEQVQTKYKSVSKGSTKNMKVPDGGMTKISKGGKSNLTGSISALPENVNALSNMSIHLTKDILTGLKGIHTGKPILGSFTKNVVSSIKKIDGTFINGIGIRGPNKDDRLLTVRMDPYKDDDPDNINLPSLDELKELLQVTVVGMRTYVNDMSKIHAELTHLWEVAGRLNSGIKKNPLLVKNTEIKGFYGIVVTNMNTIWIKLPREIEKTHINVLKFIVRGINART